MEHKEGSKTVEVKISRRDCGGVEMKQDRLLREIFFTNAILVC